MVRAGRSVSNARARAATILFTKAAVATIELPVDGHSTLLSESEISSRGRYIPAIPGDIEAVCGATQAQAHQVHDCRPSAAPHPRARSAELNDCLASFGVGMPDICGQSLLLHSRSSRLVHAARSLRQRRALAANSATDTPTPAAICTTVMTPGFCIPLSMLLM